MFEGKEIGTRRAARRLTAALVLLVPATAWAQGQPWTPAKGEFYLTPTYQYLEGGDHLTSDPVPGLEHLGTAIDFGQVSSNALVLDGDLGVTDRLALNFAAAFVAARYTAGELGLFPESEIDDGTWNSGFQDGRIGARYMAYTNDWVTLTPAMYWGFPTTAYATIGHASLGTGVKELRAGLEWGLTLPSLQRAYLTGAASYAFMDNPDDIPIDRTNITVAFGYIFRRFTVQAATDYQITHGGLDWVDDLLALDEHDEHLEAHFHSHDRAADADFWRLGFGVSVPVGMQWEAFGNFATTVWGANTHRGTTFTTGVSWRFQLFGGTDWW